MQLLPQVPGKALPADDDLDMQGATPGALQAATLGSLASRVMMQVVLASSPQLPSWWAALAWPGYNTSLTTSDTLA